MQHKIVNMLDPQSHHNLPPSPKGLLPVAHSIWSHHETITLWNSLCQHSQPADRSIYRSFAISINISIDDRIIYRNIDDRNIDDRYRRYPYHPIDIVTSIDIVRYIDRSFDRFSIVRSIYLSYDISSIDRYRSSIYRRAIYRRAISIKRYRSIYLSSIDIARYIGRTIDRSIDISYDVDRSLYLSSIIFARSIFRSVYRAIYIYQRSKYRPIDRYRYIDRYTCRSMFERSIDPSIYLSIEYRSLDTYWSLYRRSIYRSIDIDRHIYLDRRSESFDRKYDRPIDISTDITIDRSKYRPIEISIYIDRSTIDISIDIDLYSLRSIYRSIYRSIERSI